MPWHILSRPSLIVQTVVNECVCWTYISDRVFETRKYTRDNVHSCLCTHSVYTLSGSFIPYTCSHKIAIGPNLNYANIKLISGMNRRWERWFPKRTHFAMRNTGSMCTLWKSLYPYVVSYDWQRMQPPKGSRKLVVGCAQEYHERKNKCIRQCHAHSSTS